MKAPIGAIVRIFYDGEQLDRGDFLRTPSGRVYYVIVVRSQRRGAHVGRQHLVCQVTTEPPAGARVLPLHWYPRARVRRAGLLSMRRER